ncbi:MAG: hypothetical protein ABJB98_08680 [Actinomycetota bacterium]
MATITALLPSATATATPAAVTQDPVQAAAGWLTTQFADPSHLPAPDGDHFDAKYGSSYFADYGVNADAIFGLAAAHAGKSKIAVALNYLESNLDGYADLSKSQGGPYDGAIGKVALAAIVAGADPTSFGGHNLLEALKADECTAATATEQPCAAAGAPRNIYSSVSAALVVLAEARAAMSHRPSAALLAYFLSLQCADGGFTVLVTACGTGPSDLDATAYAIDALTAVGGHNQELTGAVSWLSSQRKAGGYWVSQGTANTNTTGLAAAALAPHGVDVAETRGWLRSQQVPAGHPGAAALAFAGSFTATTLSAVSPSVRATAQGLTGLVDGGSLAKVSATGAATGVSMFAPSSRLTAGTVGAGGKLTVTGYGFAAGELVDVVLHSSPTTVGGATVAPDGGATLTFNLPRSASAGAHTVEMIGRSSGLSASSAVTITAPSALRTPTSAGAPPAGSAPTSSIASRPQLAATGRDDRMVLTLGLLGLAAVVAGSALVAIGRWSTS